jgi:hypothetical protein
MLYDECFRQEVEALRWHLIGKYPHTTINGRDVSLHHFVWQLSGRPLPEAPLTIDHANRTPLDNRLENLRAATKTLQAMNKTTKTRALPTGVLFVGSYRKDSFPAGRPYKAQVVHEGRQYHCGYHATPEEASAAYEKKREELMSLELSLSSPE